MKLVPLEIETRVSHYMDFGGRYDAMVIMRDYVSADITIYVYRAGIFVRKGF